MGSVATILVDPNKVRKYLEGQTVRVVLQQPKRSVGVGFLTIMISQRRPAHLKEAALAVTLVVRTHLEYNAS